MYLPGCNLCICVAVLPALQRQVAPAAPCHGAYTHRRHCHIPLHCHCPLDPFTVQPIPAFSQLPQSGCSNRPHTAPCTLQHCRTTALPHSRPSSGRVSRRTALRTARRAGTGRKLHSEPSGPRSEARRNRGTRSWED